MFVLEVTPIVDELWRDFIESGEINFADYIYNKLGHNVNWGSRYGDAFHTVEFTTEAEMIQFKLRFL